MSSAGQSLQTVVDTLRRYTASLGPKEKSALEIGLRLSHMEEALAHGEFERASSHASALGDRFARIEATGAYVLTVEGREQVGAPSIVTWTPLERAGAIFDTVPYEDRRSALMAALPLPGIALAKLLGATWPMATVTGVASAPLLLLAVSWWLNRQAQPAG